MRITALVENIPGSSCCTAAHGLSLYIEANHKCILMDAGPSGVLMHNADALHADLRRVDVAVLSHGHYDHADGFAAFSGVNPAAPIYMHKGAGQPFFSGSSLDGSLHYIGISAEISALSQLRVVEGDVYEIDENLILFSGMDERECWPESNRRLSVHIGDRLVQDDFSHEQCLVVRENGKSVLLSGCAHNGILNILRRYETLFHALPDVVISGFHMKKSAPYTPDEIETICRSAHALRLFPCRFYTCHCTGMEAYERMKEIMGDQLSYLHCGDTLEW